MKKKHVVRYSVITYISFYMNQMQLMKTFDLKYQLHVINEMLNNTGYS